MDGRGVAKFESITGHFFEIKNDRPSSLSIYDKITILYQFLREIHF